MSAAVYVKRLSHLEEIPALTIPSFSSICRLSRASFRAARDLAS